MAAHGAEIGVDFQILIVIGACEIGIERKVEMFLPIQGGAGFGEFIIAVARMGNS